MSAVQSSDKEVKQSNRAQPSWHKNMAFIAQQRFEVKLGMQI